MRVPDKESAYTDIHVHAVPRNGKIQAHGWRRALFALAAKRSGAHGTGLEAARTYTETLARYLHGAHYVRRAVLLALDQAYDEQGTPHQEMTGFYVSNEDVLAWCREAPEIFLFGASIHPHRRDALEALERCTEQGAVLVKWLPNSQGIDPADRRLLPFYQKMAELGLPLLPWSLFLPHTDYSRFAREHNPFDRMAVLLKGLGVYPPHDGFESLLQHSH